MTQTSNSLRPISQGSDDIYTAARDHTAVQMPLLQPVPIFSLETYTVKAGEGIWQIAERLKASGHYEGLTQTQVVEQLIFANGLDPACRPGSPALKAGQVLRLSMPGGYTLRAGDSVGLVMRHYRELGYFSGLSDAELRTEIQRWLPQNRWHPGREVAPQQAPVSYGVPAPVYSNPDNPAWVTPRTPDQRLDVLRFGRELDAGLGVAYEAMSGFEIGAKWKIRTADRDMAGDDPIYKGRSGNWQSSGGWTMMDRALAQIPWYQRFNERFGGGAFSVGFRPVRFNAGDPRVKGDGYISTEAPRWEVEAKLGSLMGRGVNGMRELLSVAAGPVVANGPLGQLAGRLSGLSSDQLNRISVQVSDYVAYDGGPIAFQTSGNNPDPKRGELLRFGIKYELPFKILGHDSSIKARYNRAGEFLGFDLQIYNKQWDENLAEFGASRLPGGNIFRRFADHTRSTPELSMESGYNLPVRFYKDAQGNTYMRFPFVSSVVRLGREATQGMDRVFAALGTTPDVDAAIAQAPQFSAKDLSVIQIPEMPMDPVDMLNAMGSYMNDPRATGIADIVTAGAGGDVAERDAARQTMREYSQAVTAANPMAGGNPLHIISNAKRVAAADYFRGRTAEAWLDQHSSNDSLLDWLPHALAGEHLRAFEVYGQFDRVRRGQNVALNMHASATAAQRQAVHGRTVDRAADVIKYDAALGFIDLVHTTLRQYTVLGPNEILKDPADVAVRLQRAKAGLLPEQYANLLRDVSNPTIDFGSADLAQVNRARYELAGTINRLPVKGIQVMDGRFSWDQNCQDQLADMIDPNHVDFKALPDLNATPPAAQRPAVQAGFAPMPAAAANDRAAEIPAYSADVARELWYRNPLYVTRAIDHLLTRGLTEPLQLTRDLKQTTPTSPVGTSAGWADFARTQPQDVIGGTPAMPNEATEAVAFAKRLIDFFDAWNSDMGSRGLLARGDMPEIKSWLDIASFLIQSKARYNATDNNALYFRKINDLARLIGPVALDFGNADLRVALNRAGHTVQDADMRSLMYGSKVRAARAGQ